MIHFPLKLGDKGFGGRDGEVYDRLNEVLPGGQVLRVVIRKALFSPEQGYTVEITLGC